MDPLTPQTSVPAPVPLTPNLAISSPNSTPAPAAVLPTLPSDWPGAFGAYKYAKAASKYNLSTLIVLFILSVAIGGLTSYFNQTIVPFAVLLLLSFLVSAATAATYLAGVRRQKLSVGKALGAAFRVWFKLILLAIVTGLVLGLSFVLLVIPFILVLPRVVLATYYVIDQKLGPIKALKASWQATKGDSGKIWGIIGAGFVMVLPSITIIGVLATIYLTLMYGAVLAIVYEMTRDQVQAMPATAVGPVPAAPISSPIAATPAVAVPEAPQPTIGITQILSTPPEPANIVPIIAPTAVATPNSEPAPVLEPSAPVVITPQIITPSSTPAAPEQPSDAFPKPPAGPVVG